jgi:HK97 family phage major capsid protein
MSGVTVVSDPTFQRLDTRRKQIWEQAKGLADRAAEENRDMDGQETSQWETLMAEMRKLDQRKSDIQTGLERESLAEARTAALLGQPPDPDGPPGGNGGYAPVDPAMEERALREFCSGKGPKVYECRLPTALERRAWGAGVESRVLGDVVQGTITTGVPLPTSFVGQLYRFLVDTSSIRQTNPTVYTTSSGENLAVPRSTAEGSATWTAEGAALPPSDPTLSSVTLGAYKVAKLIQISSELLADTGFDIVGYLAEHAGRNLGIAVDTAYVAGTGTSQPTGFTNATSGAPIALTAVTGTGSLIGLPTSGTVVGADVLIELYHSVIPQYRARSSFVMHDNTIKVVRKLKDTTGQYLWQPALVAGQPDTILGRPVFADPHMPLIGTSTTPIGFGDFGGYFIRDVTPIRFERSDDFAFGTDLVSFRAIYRTDGKLGDTSAVKLYATAAS